jgi:hypothetical protein
MAALGLTTMSHPSRNICKSEDIVGDIIFIRNFDLGPEIRFTPAASASAFRAEEYESADTPA